MSNNYKYIIDFNANTQKLQQQLGGVKSMMSSVAVAAAAAFSVGAIMDFAKQSIAAYDSSIKNETALLVALKGRSDVQQSLIKQASELQNKTLFEDDETVRAQSLVAAFVKEEEKIRTLIPLIQDMATAKSMDLAGAADLVTKTLAGEMNALGRYGIQVEGAAGSTERLESIQKGLNDAFGGQAEAAALVGTGAITQLKNAFGDLQEEIGKAILASNGFDKTITSLSYGTDMWKKKMAVWNSTSATTTEKIGVFISLSKNYREAVYADAMANDAAAESAAAIAAANTPKAKEAAAKAAELAAKAAAFEAAETLRLSQTYGGITTKLSELTAKRNDLSSSDTRGIAVINAEIIALQNKKKALDELGQPTVKREKVESLTEMKTNISGDAMKITSPFEGLDSTTLGDLGPWQQQQADYLAAASQTWWDYEANVTTVANSIAGGMENIGASIVGSLGLAEDGFEGFLGGMLQTVTKLLAMVLAQSIGNAIAGATASGAATGPGAVFATPAFIAVAVGGVLAAFAAIPKFEQGGVIGGSSFSGDKMMIRVNSGEEVLRRDDPRHAFNRGTVGGGGGMDRIIIPQTRIRKGDIYISYKEAEREIGKRT